jgi:hypothetical protein
MPPPLAAPVYMLECLLTVDLTGPPQLSLPLPSPPHEDGFLELELN